MAIATFTFTT